MIILKQNEAMIQKEKNRLLTIAEKNGFLEFLEALKKTGFDFSITDFQNLSYGNKEGLIKWLQKKTLEKKPIDLPIKEDAKLNMIQLDDFNYLYNAFNLLPENRVIRNAVFSYDFDADMNLVLSASAEQRITTDYTLYGNEKQAEALQELTAIKDSIQSFFDKYKVNPHKAISCNVYNEFSLNINVISFDVK
jgi:hypothetical protein